MSSVSDLEKLNMETQAIKNVAIAGERAGEFSRSEQFKWFKQAILESLKERGINTLLNAKTDQERLKAQQMISVFYDVQKQLDYLVAQGKDAVQKLNLISTLKEDEK